MDQTFSAASAATAPGADAPASSPAPGAGAPASSPVPDADAPASSPAPGAGAALCAGSIGYSFYFSYHPKLRRKQKKTREKGERIGSWEDGLLNTLKQTFPASVLFSGDPKESLTGPMKELADAQHFLHQYGLHFSAWRIYIPFDIKPPALNRAKDAPLEFRYSTQAAGEDTADATPGVLVSFFPHLSTAQVMICIPFQQASAEELIFLHQLMHRDTKMECDFGVGRKEYDSIKGIFSYICDCMGREPSNLLSKIRAYCGKTNEKSSEQPIIWKTWRDRCENAFLLEVKRFGSYETPDALLANKANERLLYGILSGDEGYASFPPAAAAERLSHCWSSRQFARFYAFGSNFLLLNFNQGGPAIAYRDQSQTFMKDYFGRTQSYLQNDAVIAGVNHGILFSVEMCMAIKTWSGHILGIQEEKKKGKPESPFSPFDVSEKTLVSQLCGGHRAFSVLRHQQIQHIRRNLTYLLYKIEHMSLSELNMLDDLVFTNLNIAPIVDHLKYLLDAINTTIDLRYQATINKQVWTLMILDLFLSVGSIVISICFR